MKWIKLWTNETIHGTTSKELPSNLRGIWFQLLALAGLEPCYGKICINDNIPYTKEQLSNLLQVPLTDLNHTLEILSRPQIDKIKENGNGIIEIVNWSHYQSQAGYMKSYRESKKQEEEKPPPLKVKKPVNDPQVKEFIDYAFQKTQEITGTKLIIKKTNEPPAVKRLLGTIPLDRLKQLWDYFITEDFEDEWLDKAGKTITTFNSKINMLNQNYESYVAKSKLKRSL